MGGMAQVDRRDGMGELVWALVHREKLDTRAVARRTGLGMLEVFAILQRECRARETAQLSRAVAASGRAMDRTGAMMAARVGRRSA